MALLRPFLRGVAAATLATLGFCAGSARATPYEYLPVGDPIELELRVLDTLDPAPLAGRILLPRINTRPYQLLDLMGTAAPLELSDPLYAISLARIERALGRDAATWFTAHPRWQSTPRLYQKHTEGEAFEISTGLSGRAQIDKHDSRFLNGSGLESRIAVGLDKWLAYSRFVIGRFDSARTFADPIVPNNDLIVHTEDTYISYTGERQRWAMQFGQTRWHWGPGEEGSLMLSRSAPSMIGLTMRAHLQAMRLDLIALSATLEQSAGEQLAAHRVEWQPIPSVRVAISEAARYSWPGWQPLYVVGAIPYVLVQRLYLQNEPESLSVLRNNIVTSIDGSWRIANGTRIYGEFLIDDLHARSGKNPNKYAFQVGWDGAGRIGDTRLTWGGEYTRVTRYTYTSFFGRDYVVNGRSLGFPVSPDSRRFKLRADWDLNTDWQLTGTVIHSDKGENDLDEPFIPGSERVNSSEFEGTVETTREFLVGGRWWPASGVDIEVAVGYRWIDQYQHILGNTEESPVFAFGLRWLR